MLNGLIISSHEYVVVLVAPLFFMNRLKINLRTITRTIVESNRLKTICFFILCSTFRGAEWLLPFSTPLLLDFHFNNSLKNLPTALKPSFTPASTPFSSPSFTPAYTPTTGARTAPPIPKTTPPAMLPTIVFTSFHNSRNSSFT